MKSSLASFSAAVAFAVFVVTPAHVRVQSPATQAQDPHDHDHPAAADAKPATPAQQPGVMKMMADMKAADARLNALVQTMNAARGAEKTEAIAVLVTALVKEHTAMHSSMMDTMGMMNNMPGMMGTSPAKPKP